MLNVVADGENRYRLVDEKAREVGWIRGRAVRFHGFSSAEDVMDMAGRAWRALVSVLRQEHVVWRRHEPGLDSLKLVHDGAYEWISDGKVPVARLFRPPADARQEGSFAIELLLPSRANVATALRAAQAIADSFLSVDPHTASVPKDAA